MQRLRSSWFFGQRNQLFQRIGLHIQLFGQHIHLFCRRDDQLRIGKRQQMLVTVGTAETGLPHGFGDGFRLKNGAIEILVTLLEVVQHILCLCQAQRQHFVLRLQQFVLLFQKRLDRRIERPG